MKFDMGPLGPQLMAQVDSKEMTDGPLPESKVATQISVDGAETHKGKSGHKSKQEPQMACASTIMTMDIAKAIKELKAGRIEFRVDRTGNVHAPIGKVSFDLVQLEEVGGSFDIHQSEIQVN